MLFRLPETWVIGVRQVALAPSRAADVTLPPTQFCHPAVQLLFQKAACSNRPGPTEGKTICPRPICIQQGQPVFNCPTSPACQVFRVPPASAAHVTVFAPLVVTTHWAATPALRSLVLNTR